MLDIVELKKKVDFVKKLEEAVTIPGCSSIYSLDYECFEDSDGDLEKEYLVVVYKGGGVAARNCTGDSCYAIFDELTKMYNGGYYDEVEDYEYYVKNYFPIKFEEFN